MADNAPYADAVEYCLENGLMVGTSDTEFSPDESTSRAMLVTILYRNEGEPAVSGSVSFTDVENGAWYYDAVRWASDTGLVEGYDAQSFGPDDLLTREQILSILWRMDGEEQLSGVALPYTDSSFISTYAQSAVNWAYETGIIDDESTTLAPQGVVTRSDMAVMLYRYLNRVEETPAPSPTTEPEETTQPDSAIPDVHVRFGTTEFDVVLYDSATKELLMSQLSPSEMMLPTSYDMDNVCKYYDIPSRYLSYMGIVTEEITEVQAGDLLINEDGRLFLYYEDAEISGDYMRVGYVTDMTGITEALGDGSITFYVSEYTGSEDDSESVLSNAVPVTGTVTQLENGLSAVRFEGDDFLDEFIAQNGASSDAEVIHFLQDQLGANSADLELELGGFACSTLAADGENGGKLFGRILTGTPAMHLLPFLIPQTVMLL